jgi:hypothetical protein
MRALLISAGCALLLVAGAEAQAPGTADGTLTVNGETVTLKHAYARSGPGAFAADTDDIRVVLTDRPVDAAVLADDFAIGKLVRAGQVRGVEVIVSAGKEPISGSILDRAFKGSMSVAGVHRLEIDKQDGDRFAGRLYMEKPSTFMDVTFQYQARFDTPIVRRPPSQTASSQDLESTPQARTVRAFMKAVAAGDLNALRRTLSAEALKELEGMDAKETLEMMKAFLPQGGAISSIEVEGTTAAVKIVEKEAGMTSTTTVRLVLENKEWKISP